jgi:CRISPR type I-E-associated protein CasB/Cse2
MKPTEQYILVLTNLKDGEKGLLRTHAGQRLDQSIHGFDLFAGIWWPLRAKSAGAPRREVAWLIAKLYAFRKIPHSPGESLARQLRKCQPNEQRAKERFCKKFDLLLTLTPSEIEPLLQWALGELDSKGLMLDWVQLTDDLSIWERESTRLKWAEIFLGMR